MNDSDIDEILGITRCARCGHRLEGEIECPFCSLFPEKERAQTPTWIYLTACFLTSPLSLYAIVTTKRLSLVQKVIAGTGCLFWLGLWRLLW